MPDDQPTTSNLSQKEQLLAAVSKILAEEGGWGMSMGELAKHVGVSRPTLYYHFKDKAEIMSRLVEDITGEMYRLLPVLEGRDYQSYADQLRELCYERSMVIFAKKFNFRLLVQYDKALPEPEQDKHDVLKKELLRHHRDLIAKGTAAGEFVTPDATTSALAIIGISNWAAWWFDDERNDAQTTAALLAELALNSIRAEGERQPKLGILVGNVEASLARLRAAID